MKTDLARKIAEAYVHEHVPAARIAGVTMELRAIEAWADWFRPYLATLEARIAELEGAKVSVNTWGLDFLDQLGKFMREALTDGLLTTCIEARIAGEDESVPMLWLWASINEKQPVARIRELAIEKARLESLVKSALAGSSGKVAVACDPMGDEPKHEPFLGWREDATWMICEWRDGALFTTFGHEDITDDPPTAWMPLFWPDDFVAIELERLREINSEICHFLRGTFGETDVLDEDRCRLERAQERLAALLKEADDV